MRKSLVTLLVAVMIPGMGLAIDPPHDGISCADCHSMHATSPGIPLGNPMYTTINNLCTSCHKSGGTAIEVSTHASPPTKYDMVMDCTACHDPHKQPTVGAKFLREIRVRTPNNGLQDVDLSYPYASPGSPWNGLCQTCHNSTAKHDRDGAGDMTHGSPGTGACLGCHPHLNQDGYGFQGAGGDDCMLCHVDPKNGRRAVVDDFSQNSHHVGNGRSMGGSLTNFDCVVCHAEGSVQAGEVKADGPHMDGVIDLRNADDTSSTFQFDVDSVVNWDASDTIWLQETRGDLDPFCLTCHDADGALIVANEGYGDPTASALNPFGDGTITNPYDQLDRTRVINVDDQVTSYGGDLDKSSEPRGQDGIPDPIDGIYSRHAVRDRSVSIYGTTVMGGWVNGWDDTKVMSCADCHTSDGANRDAGNAHGSDSEYLLKDASGGATEGTYSGQSYICYRCHGYSSYSDTNHTGNGSDWVDTTDQVGSNRASNEGNALGMACGNCHGGYGFGTIHGTSQTFSQGGGGTREAYRFTNGASLRFYDTGNSWTDSSSTCYTLGKGQNDQFGSCLKHNRGTGHTVPSRPLTY